MIMQHHLKQQPESKYLPYVIPFILYCGKEDYKVATSVLDLFPDLALGQKMISGNMQVISPYSMPDEALKEKLWSGMLQLVMKHIYDTNIIEFLELYRDSLKTIGNSDFIYIKRIIHFKTKERTL